MLGNTWEMRETAQELRDARANGDLQVPDSLDEIVNRALEMLSGAADELDRLADEPICTSCRRPINGEPGYVGTRQPEDGLPHPVLCPPCAKLDSLYWLFREPYFFEGIDYVDPDEIPTSIIEFLQDTAHDLEDDRPKIAKRIDEVARVLIDRVVHLPSGGGR